MSEFRARAIAASIRSSLVAISLVGVGCGPATEIVDVDVEGAEELIGQSEAEIVGGTPANGDPAVVAITVGGMPFCSGTLVAPQTVVTAAHCVYAFGTQYPYYVFFGSQVDTQKPSQFVPVEAQLAHPSYGAVGAGDPYDIAVLKLVAPVTGVTPIELNDTGLSTSDVGASIRHVGFGVTSSSNSQMGRKRQAQYLIRQVAAAQLESGTPGKQTCNGDSGGPAFMVTAGSNRERLAGVVSYGDSRCRQFGVDTRVDVHAPWLKAVYGQWEVAVVTP